jgi:hypothetical protein
VSVAPVIRDLCAGSAFRSPRWLTRGLARSNGRSFEHASSGNFSACSALQEPDHAWRFVTTVTHGSRNKTCTRVIVFLNPRAVHSRVVTILCRHRVSAPQFDADDQRAFSESQLFLVFAAHPDHGTARHPVVIGAKRELALLPRAHPKIILDCQSSGAAFGPIRPNAQVLPGRHAPGFAVLSGAGF